MRLVPAKNFDPPRWIANFVFGTKQTKLLNAVLDDTALKFDKWAVGQLTR